MLCFPLILLSEKLSAWEKYMRFTLATLVYMCLTEQEHEQTQVWAQVAAATAPGETEGDGEGEG